MRRGGLGGAQAGGPDLRAGGRGPHRGDDGPARDPRGGRGGGRSAGAGQRGRRRVGSYAVQIAAALGAEVTGVCGTRNVELVRSIGAAHVVDYTTDDFTAGRTRYDVILDNISSLPLYPAAQGAHPTGTLVLNGGGSPGHVFGPVAGIVRAVVAGAFGSQRLRPLPSRQNRDELLAVTGLIEDGKLTPVVGPHLPPGRYGRRACATWSRGMRAARPSSSWREIGGARGSPMQAPSSGIARSPRAPAAVRRRAERPDIDSRRRNELDLAAAPNESSLCHP